MHALGCLVGTREAPTLGGRPQAQRSAHDDARRWRGGPLLQGQGRARGGCVRSQRSAAISCRSVRPSAT